MTSEARTGHEADEDGFHEIQLNGKQLVFLGMTTTLVSVVIFLCGVLVGRGVKPIEPVAEAASAATAPAAAPVADTTPPAETPPSPVPEPEAVAATPPPAPENKPATPPASTPPAATPSPASSTTAAKSANAPAPVEELSYYDALQKGGKKPARKTPEPVAKAATPPPVPAAQAEPEVATVPPAVAPDAPAATPDMAATDAPAKSGAIAVQVAALTSRADAEAIARKLSGKGYAAYVLSPAPGAKQVFKVRVGNYASADEAERVSRRLKQEEKLQPWVIR